MKPLNTRGRIAVLVMLAAVPALLLSLYLGVAQRWHSQSHAHSALKLRAQAAAAQLAGAAESGGLTVEKIDDAAAKFLPHDGTLAVLDQAGRVFARHPTTDRTLSGTVLESINGKSTSMFEAIDDKGISHIYALENIRTAPDGRGTLNVLLGVPRSVLYAEAGRRTFGALAGFIIAAGLLLFAAWYGPEIAFLRRFRALLAVTNHIRAGDLTARTRFPQSDEELCHLGHALDDMAQALQKRDADLKHALRELSEQVITDPLTRLNNRRYLWDFLGRDLIRARRAVLPVAAILFDIDHFKRFNDTWGHEAGDLVLKSVADVIRQNVRGSDIACRYGGEEFIVVLPEATRNVAVERADQIRRDIERMELMLGERKLDRVTASFGVALYPTHADDAEALVRVADDALYQAKEAGRNRVHVFETAPSLL